MALRLSGSFKKFEGGLKLSKPAPVINYPSWIGMETTVADTMSKGHNNNSDYGIAFDDTYVYTIHDNARNINRKDSRNPNRYDGSFITHHYTTWGNPQALEVVGTELAMVRATNQTYIEFINLSSGTYSRALNVGVIPKGVAYDGTNLLVLTASSVRLHDPVTGTLNDTVNLTGLSNCKAIAWTSQGMVIANYSTVTSLHFFSGNTATELSSYTNVPAGTPYDMAFDGTNLVVAHGSHTYVHSGLDVYAGSTTVEYTGPF